MADCSSWWFDHVGETYIYVLGTKNANPSVQQGAVAKLVAGASDWGDLTRLYDAGRLMGVHVGQAKALADAAFAQDKAGVDNAVETLLANAAQQADYYEANIPGFPKADFGRLFTAHIANTGGYILALASGDGPDFSKNYAATLANRNELARFWGKVCLLLMR